MKKTFIKMQSLSRKAWLCGGLIAMAAALVGCSSDAPDPGDPNSGVAQTDGDPLTVISDQATLSGMVLNYESNTPNEAPKAFTLPEIPDYSKAVSVNSDEFKNHNGELSPYKDQGIIIPAEKVYDGDFNVNTGNDPINIFIVGTLKGDIKNSGAANVYVLGEGMWITSSLSHNANLNIYDYDNGLTFTQDNVNVTCTYHGKNFKHRDKTFNFSNNVGVFVEGEIEADKFTLSGKGSMSANCLVANDVYITNEANHYVGSYIKAENLEITANGCIYLNENAYVKVNNKLKSTNGYAGFNSPNGKSVIYAKEYETSGSLGYTWNGDKSWLEINESGKFRGHIYVYVGKITGSEGQEIKADQLQTGGNVKFLSGSYFESFKDPMSECPSGEGNKPNPDPVKPNPGPDPFPNNPDVIIEITGKDVHSHPISATCIDVAGDMAYVSWHERGGNIHGCIEAIKIDGETATITSWMETDAWTYNSGQPSGDNSRTAYDFNHIIYDNYNNVLLTVGEHAWKGGFIGRINLANIGNGENDHLNVLENRQLGIEEYEGNINTGLVAGRSGNCVVISPDRTKLLVASRGGYQKIPYGAPGSVNDPFAVGEDFKHLITSKMMEAISTSGSGKHLALFGNSLVSIEYTASSKEADWWEDNTTALPAKITFWDNWENFPYNHTFTIDVDAFSPVFGKDVIAMDDQYIYSCQGHRGVAIYEKSSGSEKARFNVDRYIREHRNYFTRDEIIRMTGAAANGLAVDDKYIYIAYGGAGLWVLNKATFDVEGYYSAANSYNYEGNTEPKKASANYVKVMNDGKIFVAYGRDGVKVFKMPLGK